MADDADFAPPGTGRVGKVTIRAGQLLLQNGLEGDKRTAVVKAGMEDWAQVLQAGDFWRDVDRWLAGCWTKSQGCLNPGNGEG